MREMPIFSPRRSSSVLYLDSLPTMTAQLSGLVTYVPTSLNSAVFLAMPAIKDCRRAGERSARRSDEGGRGRESEAHLGQRDGEVDLARLDGRHDLARAACVSEVPATSAQLGRRARGRGRAGGTAHALGQGTSSMDESFAASCSKGEAKCSGT